MKKPELLAPAGSLAKLKYAIMYGADAVYIGGEAFSLRVAAKNFSIEEIKEGIAFAHDRGAKVYITANIIPHNSDLDKFPDFVKEVAELGADAIIVSDLGAFSIVRSVAPELDVHISTQANNTNYSSASMWHSMGAKRVILARDLSFGEIEEIRTKTPEDLEIECFVHGAMCVSYSGRCLLSNYLTHRDSNRGACSHPCRWKYYLMEEKRPGEYMPVFENERGTFIFNSKDLCMIEHIPELIKAGVTSFKIEGRVKNELYVATVVKAYRDAIDAYFDNDENYKVSEDILTELTKVSHREYTNGFYFGKPTDKHQLYTSNTYIQEYTIAAVVKGESDGMTVLEQRNKFEKGDVLEVLNPDGDNFSFKVDDMYNDRGELIESAPHAQMEVRLKLPKSLKEYAILRMLNKNYKPEDM
ncbi:MAG: U32 family peptidase C-terminal domain-containing protein [Clostridia bacterium]|nr:U32 family peptidase C-terminal domain-containing protein [Clostridia bacterium]